MLLAQALLSIFSLLILFYYEMCFSILLYIYILYFNGFPCYTVGYYNYNYIWLYYIVIL